MHPTLLCHLSTVEKNPMFIIIRNDSWGYKEDWHFFLLASSAEEYTNQISWKLNFVSYKKMFFFKPFVILQIYSQKEYEMSFFSIVFFYIDFFVIDEIDLRFIC